MGTEGMKASLISREVIADSIELVVRGHLLDGVVCLVGCDKTIPAAAMAWAGSMFPGSCSTTARSLRCVQGRAHRHGRKGLRGHRRVSGGEAHARRAVRDRECRLPRAGACGGQFTANTMSTVLEFLDSRRPA